MFCTDGQVIDEGSPTDEEKKLLVSPSHLFPNSCQHPQCSQSVSTLNLGVRYIPTDVRCYQTHSSLCMM